MDDIPQTWEEEAARMTEQELFNALVRYDRDLETDWGPLVNKSVKQAHDVLMKEFLRRR